MSDTLSPEEFWDESINSIVELIDGAGYGIVFADTIKWSHNSNALVQLDHHLYR
jgi:hypothetical protein